MKNNLALGWILRQVIIVLILLGIKASTDLDILDTIGDWFQFYAVWIYMQMAFSIFFAVPVKRGFPGILLALGHTLLIWHIVYDYDIVLAILLGGFFAIFDSLSLINYNKSTGNKYMVIMSQTNLMTESFAVIAMIMKIVLFW